MVILGGVAAIVAGAGGIVLSQVGSLIPSKKDFMASMKLKRAACIEKHAASHCFLLKQFLSVGLEDFDNTMRGDGRTSRDFFSEHTQITIKTCNEFVYLNRSTLEFRLAHWGLLISTIALIVLGIIVTTSAHQLPYALIIGLVLFITEIVAIVSLYALADANED